MYHDISGEMRACVKLKRKYRYRKDGKRYHDVSDKIRYVLGGGEAYIVVYIQDKLGSNWFYEYSPERVWVTSVKPGKQSVK